MPCLGGKAMQCISKNCFIGKNTKLGNFTTIEEYVEIGDNCIIGNNVTIYKGTRLGNNIRIDDNCVIGKQPMKAATSATSKDELQLPCVIGDKCIVGTSVVIYAGSIIKSQCLIADLSTIREDVTIGEKTIIGRGVAVENHCHIGSYCKLETNVYITAYSEIEDYVFIAPGVVTSNDNFASRSQERFNHFKGVTIKKGGRVGAQATILPGKVIESDGFVAAASVVTKDVMEKTIVLGNPARMFRAVPKDQLLENNYPIKK